VNGNGIFLIEKIEERTEKMLYATKSLFLVQTEIGSEIHYGELTVYFSRQQPTLYFTSYMPPFGCIGTKQEGNAAK